jgi:hypothetical protein
LLLGVVLLACLQARAGDFRPLIEVGGFSVKEADAPEARVSDKPAERKKTTLTAGRKTPLRWAMAYKGGKMRPDVLVHFYVVKEERLGQPAIRNAKSASIVMESALTADFKPGDDSRAEVDLSIEEAGLYMVRIEAFADGEALVSATMDLEVTQ